MSRRIILVAPSTYGISAPIVAAMRAHLNEQYSGSIQLEFVDEQPIQDVRVWQKFALKILSEQAMCRAFRKLIETLNLGGDDQIVFIRARYLNDQGIAYLRRVMSPDRMSLYVWDSEPNLPYFAKQLTLFQKVLSFDPKDAAKYNIPYLPLFLPPTEVSTSFEECPVDIGYYGTCSGQRLEAAEIVSDYARWRNLKFENALYVSKFQYLKAMLKSRKQCSKMDRYSNRSPIAAGNILRVSKVIFDFCEPEQNGASFRLFEAITNGRKIITNNTALHEILGESNDVVYFNTLKDLPQRLRDIPKEFFQTAPSYILPSHLLLENWIKELLP